MARVLIACEESQAVCKEFRRLGHEAYSCDTEPCSGGHPEWHIQDDVLKHLEGWDMIIAFPPCTHLAASGAPSFEEKRKDGRQQQAVDFFMAIINSPCSMIAVENPVGIMSSLYRKPNQIVQPYYFGDPDQKKTCLWLKGIPPLRSTNIVEPIVLTFKSKRNKSGVSTYGRVHSAVRGSKARSKTFPGIARAMAEQWSILLK